MKRKMLLLCGMKQNPKTAKPAPKKAVLEFPLQRKNFLILIGGVVIMLLGFLLMSGGGSADPNVFSEEIFSSRRITVAPIVVLLGFATVGFGIMYKPKKSA
jgi:hypothetical protein